MQCYENRITELCENPKTWLIAGVAGFIGSNLADYLITKNQYEVIGIDNLSYGLKNQISSQVDFYEKDICDRDISKLLAA